MLETYKIYYYTSYNNYNKTNTHMIKIPVDSIINAMFSEKLNLHAVILITY